MKLLSIMMLLEGSHSHWMFSLEKYHRKLSMFCKMKMFKPWKMKLQSIWTLIFKKISKQELHSGQYILMEMKILLFELMCHATISILRTSGEENGNRLGTFLIALELILLLVWEESKWTIIILNWETSNLTWTKTLRMKSKVILKMGRLLKVLWSS